MALSREEYLKKINSVKSKKIDLSTSEGLASYAKEKGLEKQVNDILDTGAPKLSFLQRLSSGLGALNPAEAILTGQEQGVVEGAKKYVTGAVGGIAGAITGRDYQGERRTFSDVAEKIGIENGIVKFGVGFLGDVFLDPSTYFGGAIARGILGGTKLATKGVVSGIGKVSPEAEQGLKLTAQGLQDTFGRAFNYGYKSTKGAKEDVMTFLSKEQQAKLGLAASNLNRLGTGVLSKAQSEELASKLIAGKRAEFLAREGEEVFSNIPKSADPLVQKTIEEQAIRSKKFATQIGLENPYETYFPFIKKDKVNKFINETRGIRVGSEGYKKQFKNLLTNENLETDPAKAFFTRESQVVSDNMTRDFLGGFVKRYGKGLDEFKSVDDALKNGYTLIREKGIFGKELGYVNKYDGALIRDSLSPEFQTINMLAKATGFDAVTSLFKRSVTGLFAPFHIRNYMSGMIQNYEVLGREALDPRNIAVGQKIAYLMGSGKKIPDAVVKLAGKETKLSKIMKPFVDRFSGDTFYNNDFDMALKSGNEIGKVAGVFSKARLKETVKTLGLGEEAIPFKVGRSIGQFIEHQQKATAYVTALNQGKKIEDALMIAEKAGFDYRALTRFESQILRRVIPFYSFTRKNIELQMKTLGENPQRINQVLNFFENIGEQPSQEEKEGLPDYIKESIGVKLPDTADGLKQYINSFGTPIESFAQLFNKDIVLQTISQMNPLIKAPIELGIGKDSFRKKDLKDVYNASEYSAAPQIIKDMLDIKEVMKPIYDKNKYGKLVKTGERKEYVADPNKLLIARSLFTSRGVSYLDQVFDGDLNGFVKFIKLFSGIKPTEIDLEVTKALKDKQQRRAMEDLLIKMGYLRKYESTYEPKQ
jgi:hypothetical protein